jgi:phosphoribosylamine--glycine ligase
VLEFNCRFGDPETQAILPLLGGDIGELLRACAEGQLDPSSLMVAPGAAVCIVQAAHGYPESPRRGDRIVGMDDAERSGALVFHAGTTLRGGHVVTDGGRVLSVVETGPTLADARRRAYAAANLISFPGMQMRRDIASVSALVPA